MLDGYKYGDVNMQKRLRVLITNNTLASRAGSELYVRDLAISLMQRGHNPVAYSTVLGDVAEELRKATIPVINDLQFLADTPDLIHGQHHLDAMTAMTHFPDTPAIFFCHGWLPWEERPPIFPSIKRYIAVDDLCMERLLSEGIASEDIETVYNFIDLKRFVTRSTLPKKPLSALIFSNYAAETNYVGIIRSACHRFGIQKVDTIGLKSGNVTNKPEEILGNYDIVFAKARCALEAMASGCAVIVADFSGLGGMVTSKEMEKMRKLNFGARVMQKSSITEDNILSELQQYDNIDAQRVTDWVRTHANMDKAIDQLLNIYNSVLIKETSSIKNQYQYKNQLLAASKYLCSLSIMIKNPPEAEIYLHQACELKESKTNLATKLLHASKQFFKRLRTSREGTVDYRKD